MNFRRYCAILAALLVAVLVVQPALSAQNMTDVLTKSNVRNVTNQTEELQHDNATTFFNYAQRQLAGCRDTCDFRAILSLYDQALAENLTMLKKTDGLQYLYEGKAYIQIQLKDYPAAAATADAGLGYYPKDPILWNNKGYALEKGGSPQDALAAYTKATTLDGNYTNAFINKGNLLTTLGKYPDAIAAYTQANQTDPFNVAASDGLEAARKGESDSGRTTTILLVIALIVAAGIVVWYVRFRKPADKTMETKGSATSGKKTAKPKK